MVATLARNGLSGEGLVPKDVAVFANQSFDYVIALCNHAHEECPGLAGADKIHWTFPSPTEIADEAGRNHAFEDVFQGLANRIRLLVIVDEHA
jgi:ArsR family transcriptional regulator